MNAPVLSFDLTGRFAHFRARYTTTSPVTHLVPPRHTIAGIIGAILGVPREEVSDVFSPKHSLIGLEVTAPLSTTKLMTKLLKVKGGRTLQTLLSVKEHILVPFQLVREPSYRIYFTHQDKNIMSTLETMLRKHECVYSPALGLASLLANVEFVASYENVIITRVTEIHDKEAIETKSVAPLPYFNPVPTPDNHFIIDKFARHLTKERIPTGFLKVIFDANAHVMRGVLSHPKLEEEGNKNREGMMGVSFFQVPNESRTIFVW